MAQSFQREKPPARVNLFLEVQDGGAAKKKELPLRMMGLGDYTGREDNTPLEQRKPISLDKDNFEQVLKSLDVTAEVDVPDKLREGNEEAHVSLKFDSMKSFKPEEVARQVPELNKMLAMRNLLQDLRNRVVSTSEFRKQLEQLTADLDRLAGPDPSSDADASL